MNLSDMLAIVRRDLHDEEESNYRFTDDELARHIRRAVKDFSESIPLEQTVLIETTAGSRDIDISEVTGRVMVEAVEYQAGKFPPRFQRFSLWADTLTLLGDVIPDGTDARVYYGGLHTIGEEGSTIPEMYEDLIATGAVGYSAMEYAAFSINRVNTGGTASVGDFLTLGKEQLKIFRQELKRLGRRNRVRVRSLYTPWDAPVSKTVVSGLDG
jgi:hypothetical protein